MAVRLPDNVQYGDMKRLTQLASGLKMGNADDVPTPRNPVGRPPGSTAVAAAPVPTGAGIPAEHLQVMEEAARAVRTAGIGRQVAADPLAGPWLRVYAQMADEDAAEQLRKVKALTPDYAVE